MCKYKDTAQSIENSLTLKQFDALSQLSLPICSIFYPLGKRIADPTPGVLRFHARIPPYRPSKQRLAGEILQRKMCAA
jgi:hypothetical protein